MRLLLEFPNRLKYIATKFLSLPSSYRESDEIDRFAFLRQFILSEIVTPLNQTSNQTGALLFLPLAQIMALSTGIWTNTMTNRNCGHESLFTSTGCMCIKYIKESRLSNFLS